MPCCYMILKLVTTDTKTGDTLNLYLIYLQLSIHLHCAHVLYIKQCDPISETRVVGGMSQKYGNCKRGC